jgi:hypothetical protein
MNFLLLKPNKVYQCKKENEMTNFEKTVATVNYVNKCINAYSNEIEWWSIIYSLDGWAEVYATDAFDSELSDYAPVLSDKFTMLKEYIDRGNKIFEADIDSLIKKFGLNLQESKLHLKLVPILI